LKTLRFIRKKALWNFWSWVIMKFPKGTRFKDGVDPDTGQKIKIAILPGGEEIKFFTEENLENI
jgi:hypothetical protein